MVEIEKRKQQKFIHYRKSEILFIRGLHRLGIQKTWKLNSLSKEA